jgi:hypothetical protein
MADLGEGEAGLTLAGPGEGIEAGQVQHQVPLTRLQGAQLQGVTARVLPHTVHSTHDTTESRVLPLRKNDHFI